MDNTKLFNNNDEVVIYALDNHVNAYHITKEEFMNDFKKFKVVSRHLKKYGISKDKVPLVINNVITLINLFNIDSTNNILLYYVEFDHVEYIFNILGEL